MDKLFVDLYESYFSIVYDLRHNDGFNEYKFNELCQALERCKIEWEGQATIPRTAVKILIEIVPTIDLFIIYNKNKSETDRLKDAVDKLKSLIHDAVNSEELWAYIDSKNNKEVPINQRYLWIDGKVSAKTLKEVQKGLTLKINNNSDIFFVGYAYEDIPVGKQFEVVFKKSNPINGIPCKSIIKAVTQQFGKPFEHIPNGWKTICIIEFPEGIPQIIKDIPITNRWFEINEKELICISDKQTWKSIIHSTHD